MSEMLETFFEFLRFPSISARPDHATDVRRCATWLGELLGSWGISSEVRETGGAPLVIAHNKPEPHKKTVLLYGHYDVQPVEPLELWTTPPFAPAIRDGLIYARGATDNKGQTFSHLIGLREMLAQGELPVNLIVLIEGEEEVGSPHLSTFLRENKDSLKCDVALISDTSMIEQGWPALTLGLRGIACFDLEVTGPRLDLHSGIFGGATPNPALALARVLARLHDAEGRIAIPGLYDDVWPISELERASWEKLPWNEDWFAQNTGIAPTAGEKGVSVLERVWARPTAEINGMTSGHQGAGSKTIIPSKASAKLSFRLVPNQDPDQIAGQVVTWFEKEFTAEGMSAAVTYDHGGLPFHTPAESPYIQSAMTALEEVFGKTPALTREGISIPVAAMLRAELGVPVVLAGLGLPDCKAHSPDESYPVAHLELGARVFQTIIERWSGLAGH